MRALVDLRKMIGDGLELRFDLAGVAAVRVAGGPVAARHVEPAPPSAPWVAEARCGTARGWLLAADIPPDPQAARDQLEREVAERTARELQALGARTAAIGIEAVGRLVHRLSTDVMTLQTVAEAALRELFDAADRASLPGELERTGREAQRRLTDMRAILGVLAPLTPRPPEAIVATLSDELEGTGRTSTVTAPDGELALTRIPGVGWAGVAQRLAEDGRLGNFTVTPDPAGWRLSAGAPTGETVDWSEPELGALAHAGHLVVAAGGSALAVRDSDGQLGVSLVLPAAPPP